MAEKTKVPEKAPRVAEWKIQKRSRACAVCTRSFSDGERYHSALEPGDGGFLRSDYCGGCWPGLSIEERGVFSLWQGKFTVEEPAKKPEAIETTRAEDLFARLVQSTEPASLKLAYVFALLLERKKKLSRKGRAARDGSTYLIYEHPRTGRAFMVQDVDIDLRDASVVQEDLNRLLVREGVARPPGGAPSPDREEEPGDGGCSAEEEPGETVPESGPQAGQT